METEALGGFGNADDMIRANGEAEAREREKLGRENEDLRLDLSSMKELYRKNSALADRAAEAAAKAADAAEKVSVLADSMGESAGKAADAAEKVSVLADKMGEAAGEAAPETDEEQEPGNGVIVSTISAVATSLDKKLRSQGEEAHKDSVSVYRNVQAAMVTELDKQTKELNSSVYGLSQQIASLSEAVEEIRADEKALADEIAAEKPKGGVLRVLTFLLGLVILAYLVLDSLGYVDAFIAFLTSKGF